MLAGLIADEDRTGASKVPRLGDLPLLGRLFSNQRDELSKTEIVLLITPRIIRNIERPELADGEFFGGTESAASDQALQLRPMGRPAARDVAPGPAARCTRATVLAGAATGGARRTSRTAGGTQSGTGSGTASAARSHGRAMSRWQHPRRAGFTLIELVITVAIVGVLALLAAPLMEVTAQRHKEAELHLALRQIREAIDAYHQTVLDKKIASPADASGYPPDLESLVAGVPDITKPDRPKIYFLRRLPRDPMHPDATLVAG